MFERKESLDIEVFGACHSSFYEYDNVGRIVWTA
jgi:hypothetical protein